MTRYIAQQKGATPNDDSLAIAPTLMQLRSKIEDLHLPTHDGLEILQTVDCKIKSRFDLVDL